MIATPTTATNMTAATEAAAAKTTTTPTNKTALEVAAEATITTASVAADTTVAAAAGVAEVLATAEGSILTTSERVSNGGTHTSTATKPSRHQMKSRPEESGTATGHATFHPGATGEQGPGLLRNVRGHQPTTEGNLACVKYK